MFMPSVWFCTRRTTTRHSWSRYLLWCHSGSTQRKLFSTAVVAQPPVVRPKQSSVLWRPVEMSSPPSKVTTDIEELHQQALCQKATTYRDPSTGFTVWTERAHLLRGNCCGNQCRHCPYGWTNVVPKNHPTSTKNHSSPITTAPPIASGHVQAIQVRLQALDALASNHTPETTTCQEQNHPAARKTKTGGRHGGRFTDKNVPYTRSGDQGTSSLFTGERRSKADVAFDAMGTVDELCAIVGVVHALLVQIPESTTTANAEPTAQLEEQLLDIMSRLFDIGSHVAKPSRGKKDDDGWSSSSSDEEERPRFVADGLGGGFDATHVQQLEDWIDIMTQDLPELTSFLLPTGSVLAAQLHVARTVARRAERVMVPLVVDRQVCDPTALQYINRLSDYFFTAARWANVVLAQAPEIQYRRPYRNATQRQRTTTTTTSEP